MQKDVYICLKIKKQKQMQKDVNICLKSKQENQIQKDVYSVTAISD